MSWLARQYAVWRSSIGIPYEHVQVEPSELRNALV